MKSLLKPFLLHVTCVIYALSLSAQTTENFNSRQGLATENITGFLQNHCWQFSNMDIANNDKIEGDASLVSIIGSSTASLYTPALNIWGNFNLSFKYAFDTISSESRSINIYLTNANNEVISLIDNIDVTGAEPSKIYTYSESLPADPGVYKLHIRYQGNDAPVIRLDNISIAANQRYAGGCNQGPQAAGDVIVGKENKEAAGNLLKNDIDVNGETLAAYLISDSKDGHVTVATNGDFTFTPRPGFKGTSTSFTYQVCDYGYNQLCSQETTVKLIFPINVKTEINDMQANYRHNAVTFKWATSTEGNTERFEIERSIDGSHFDKAGVVKAVGNTTVKHAYFYEDQLSESFTKKNDLFYRLKQVDREGNEVYSKLLLVRVFETKTIQTVSVTPNPVVNDIKVHLQLNEQAYVVIKLRALNGGEIMRKSLKGLKGENTFSLPGSEKIKKGVYMLEVIINSNERMMVKLIKN